LPLGEVESCPCTSIKTHAQAWDGTPPETFDQSRAPSPQWLQSWLPRSASSSFLPPALAALYPGAASSARHAGRRAARQSLALPHDAALSPDGRLLYVTDMANSRIVVLQAMTLKTLGMFGAGETSYAHNAKCDASGRLLVADAGNDRIAIQKVDGA